MDTLNKFISFVTTKFFNQTGLNNIKLFDVGLFILIPVFCFILEILIIGWEKSSFKSLLNHFKSSNGDLICFLLRLFQIKDFLGVIISFGIITYLTNVLNKNFEFNLIYKISDPFYQFFIILVLNDFIGYVQHYFFHSFKWSWALHEYHHSAEHFNILTGYRSHLLEPVFSSIFYALPAVIFGVPLKTYLLITILIRIQNHLKHSQLESDWGFIGKYILISPAAHRLHHSNNPEHYGKNMGDVFIFWDRLFGTYHPAVKNIELGIPNNPYNKKNFLFDMYIGYKNFVLILFANFKILKSKK